MPTWLRKSWPFLKAVLALAIVVAVGRRFAVDLRSNPDLWQHSLRPGWLALSGLLYVLALSFSAWYWQRLLRQLGQRPATAVCLRAYYLGHLGKYLPGKAWALFMRATLAGGPNVKIGIAAMTAFYEVLTTMAAGMLLATVLFALLIPESSASIDWQGLRGLLRLETPDQPVLQRNALVLLSVGLLAVVGLPIIPGVFNRLVSRLSLPFKPETQLPQLRYRSLAEGILLTGCGWFLLGASLGTALEAVVAPPPPWSWAVWGRLTAYLGVAYVAGFVILVVPSGLGVREFFLTLFLVPEVGAWTGATETEARAVTVLTVLVLRLVWTTAEMVVAAIVYWLLAPRAPAR